MKNEILYSVKAQRGDTLGCKGWKQKTLLRMLENLNFIFVRALSIEKETD